jgi:hypothetical protein
MIALVMTERHGTRAARHRVTRAPFQALLLQTLDFGYGLETAAAISAEFYREVRLSGIAKRLP